MLTHVETPSGRCYPLVSLTIGPDDKTLTTLALIGGVHGLERVGARAATSFLHSLVQSLQWDRHLRRRFDGVRVVALPLVNPVGMAMRRREKGRGVDLMRNAPVDAEGKPPFLVGGHRDGPRLWWYRGDPSEPIEPEAQALCDFIAV